MPTDPSIDDHDEARPPRLSAILTPRDMAVYLTHTSISRAKTYQRQGRVHSIVISPDCKTITAAVEGTHPEPYRQTIILSPSSDSRTKINGQCTCPMGYNCKHVAAVLLEALERSAPKRPTQPFLLEPPPVAPKLPIAPAEPLLPIELVNWLQQLSLSATGDDYPSDINQRLLYLFNSYTAPNSSPHLVVDLVLARILKDGEYSGSISRQTLSNFYLGNAPRYFRSSDIEICQLLVASKAGSISPSTPYFVKTASLWKQIVGTGRAYWQNHTNSPLTLGEARPGRIEWIMPDSRGLRPVLQVENSVALNSEPPVYVDPQNNLIGEVILPIPPHMAHHLLNAPAIAPVHIAKISQSLAHYLPADTDLIPQPPAPPIVIEEAPIPVLRLMLATESANAFYRPPPSDMPIARLLFRYGPVEVALGETRPIVESVTGNRRYIARRSPSQERDALNKLFSLDLRFAREVYNLLGPSHHQDLAFSDPFYWLSFLSQDVPDLQVLASKSPSIATSPTAWPRPPGT